MEVSQLWSSIQEIQKSIGIINSELGKTMNDVAWLKASWWELLSWMRIIGGGVIIGIVLSIWNLFLIKKNGRKN